METSLIQIGNSKGIIIPNEILKKYHFNNKIELILDKEYLILKSINIPRKGWDDAFMKMNKENDDKLLVDDLFDDESFEKWNNSEINKTNTKRNIY